MAGRQEDPAPAGCGHLDRRSTIKAIALGSVALVAGFGIATPAQALAQEGWRRCTRCQGMFFAQDESGYRGACPAGGVHRAASTHYYLRMEPNIDHVQQGGWSWCPQCMGLYFSGAQGALGVCPAGGTHSNRSGGYAAVVGEDGAGQEGGWRWCQNCMGMFYAGQGAGVCPRGGGHDGTSSAAYAFLI